MLSIVIINLVGFVGALVLGAGLMQVIEVNDQINLEAEWKEIESN